MQITYDTKADALYIKFRDGEFVANKEVEEGIIFDIGKGDVLLGIEILEASMRFRPEDLARVEVQIYRLLSNVCLKVFLAQIGGDK